jgi:hypothetical protein
MEGLYINAWWTNTRKESYKVVYIVHEASQEAIQQMLTTANALIFQFNAQIHIINRAFVSLQTVEYVNFACMVLRGIHLEIRDSISKLKCTTPIVSDQVDSLMDVLHECVEAICKSELLYVRGLWSECNVNTTTFENVPQIQIYNPSTAMPLSEKTWAYLHIKNNINVWKVGKDLVKGTYPPHFVNEDPLFGTKEPRVMPWETTDKHSNTYENFPVWNPANQTVQASNEPFEGPFKKESQADGYRCDLLNYDIPRNLMKGMSNMDSLRTSLPTLPTIRDEPIRTLKIAKETIVVSANYKAVGGNIRSKANGKLCIPRIIRIWQFCVVQRIQ